MPTRDDDGDKLQIERARGRDARLILENPLVIETFETMEKNIMLGIRQCPIRDDEGLKNLRLMLKTLDDFKHSLTTVMETGRMAESQIRQSEEVTLS